MKEVQTLFFKQKFSYSKASHYDWENSGNVVNDFENKKQTEYLEGD